MMKIGQTHQKMNCVLNWLTGQHTVDRYVAI